MGQSKMEYLFFDTYKKMYPNYDITFYYPMAGQIVENTQGRVFIEIPEDFIIR